MGSFASVELAEIRVFAEFSIVRFISDPTSVPLSMPDGNRVIVGYACNTDVVTNRYPPGVFYDLVVHVIHVEPDH